MSDEPNDQMIPVENKRTVSEEGPINEVPPIRRSERLKAQRIDHERRRRWASPDSKIRKSARLRHTRESSIEDNEN